MILSQKNFNQRTLHGKNHLWHSKFSNTTIYNPIHHLATFKSNWLSLDISFLPICSRIVVVFILNVQYTHPNQIK